MAGGYCDLYCLIYIRLMGLQAWHAAFIARRLMCPSILSVRLYVTLRYCGKTARYIAEALSPPGSYSRIIVALKF